MSELDILLQQVTELGKQSNAVRRSLMRLHHDLTAGKLLSERQYDRYCQRWERLRDTLAATDRTIAALWKAQRSKGGYRP